jgi:hypothetical protein
MMVFPRSTCGFICLLIIFCTLSPAYAQQSLVVTGTGAIEGNNIAQAEKFAFDDAFSKTYLLIALRYVPASSSSDLVQKLRGFIASRGTQDILQYQILSRSQQEKILLLEIDIKLNDTPLKEWLQAQALTTPLALRPRILLMVAARGPGLTERYEWWTMNAPRSYSPFEAQLAGRLKDLGEYVSDVPQKIPFLQAGMDSTIQTASTAGADFLIAGAVAHKLTPEKLLDSRLELSLMDIHTKQRISTWNSMLRGSSDQKAMNELLINTVIDHIRSQVAKKVIIISPVVKEKTLCIDGIRDYAIYQSFINTLRSIDGITRISVASIKGHGICHTIETKGSIEDILNTLKQKQIAEADMIIDGDTATIRILNP